MSETTSAPNQTAVERETRIQEVLQRLRCDSDALLRQMAERLVDLPEEKSFGQIEYDLRDLTHRIACAAHQTGLQAGKKRGIAVPPSSAPTVDKTPASSTTATKPG